MRTCIQLLILALVFACSIAARERVKVTVVSDEAEAVLAILEKRSEQAAISDDDWRRLFESEGYVRLKKRELSMNRPFEDAEFRKFVMSDELLTRRLALVETLRRWKTIDASLAGNKALLYLPRESTITAKIYPVIKPRDNSFVFEVKTDPAIFLYLDPKVAPAKFENTLTHELHHIGFGTVCPPPEAKGAKDKLPESTQNVLGWIGAFGEGFAMIAAAGGPDVHPHAVSEPRERERWNKDVSNFDVDLKKVESFFLEVASGKLSGDEMMKKGFEFMGIQGPWYTVGWKMAALIEKTYGRKKLIEAFCDQRILLKTYNAAARKYNKKSNEKLALWTDDLIRTVGP